VVGHGPLWDLAFSTEAIFDHPSAQRADRDKLMAFHLGLIRNGVMVRAGGRSYFSTAHGDKEIEFTLDAAGKALRDI
jgi:glutamate-1-semialdehyde aminotransferase